MADTEDLAGERRCPVCGAVLTSEAILCVQCGTNLKTGEKLAGIIEEDISERHGEDEASSELNGRSWPSFLYDSLWGLATVIGVTLITQVD